VSDEALMTNGYTILLAGPSGIFDIDNIPDEAETWMHTNWKRNEGLYPGDLARDDFYKHFIVDIMGMFTKLGSVAQQKVMLEKTKKTYIDFIVHDLNNMLSILIGNVQLLIRAEERDKGKGCANKKLYVDQRILLQAKDFVENIMDITKMEAGRSIMAMGILPFDNLLKEEVEIHRESVGSKGKGINISFGDADDFDVEGDKSHLRRVIKNLLGNAVKFADKSIEIKVSKDKEGGVLIFRISNDGESIPRNVQEKIFDMFFQAELASKKDKRGTGLGLPYSRMAIEQHGGKIWVESDAENSGAAFIFQIPLKH
ncbi:MAG: HAMP domain-containing sensor histidine kinase, partial [bacterium]